MFMFILKNFNLKYVILNNNQKICFTPKISYKQTRSKKYDTKSIQK